MGVSFGLFIIQECRSECQQSFTVSGEDSGRTGNAVVKEFCKKL